MVYNPREQRGDELELFARKTGIVAAFVIGLTILFLARSVLLLIFIAAVLAAGIAPAVHRVRILGRHWFRRRIPRGTAVVIVYFPFLFAAILLAALMLPRLITDSRALAAQLPVLLEQNVLTPLGHVIPVESLRERLKGGVALPTASVLLYVKSAATAVASVVAVLFMVVYMLMDAPRLRNLILLLYPADVRGDRRAALTRMGHRMSSWLSGQLILAAIIGAATFAGLVILRIPYALPLAVLAAMGEMVPVIGPILGAIPALAVALLHSRWQFWSVLAMAVLLQKAENLLIAPRVMARKVSISPLGVFIAFMMGAALLGLAGAIIAIPVAAIVQVAFEEMFVARRERRQDVVRAGTLMKRAR